MHICKISTFFFLSPIASNLIMKAGALQEAWCLGAGSNACQGRGVHRLLIYMKKVCSFHSCPFRNIRETREKEGKLIFLIIYEQ